MSIPTEDLTTQARRLTADLIRIDTTAATAGEVAGLRFVAGLFAERDDLEVVLPTGDDGEPTCLLVLPRGPRTNLLLLSAHVDAVPAPRAAWSLDPFGAVESDGWLYGRGASDMKSGLAAQAAAVLASEPGAPVALAVSRNEENGCQGSPDVVAGLQAAGVTVGALIVGEPTAGRIILGHKGPLWIDVTTAGTAAHGSTPERGESAILKMNRLVERATRELPLRTHEWLGTETMNIGRIEGGTLRNMVPDHCRIEVDLRTVDPDPEPLLSWWRDQPETAEVSVYQFLPSVATPADDPWVLSLGREVVPQPVGFGTEAGPIAGEFGVKHVVLWGPGPLDCMHAPDERVRLDDIDTTAVGYLDAIRGWHR